MTMIDELITQFYSNEVEFKELQEIFETKNGYTPLKSNKSFWTNGTVPWFRMEDIRKNGRILNEALQQITEEAVKGARLFPANSIIISTSASIGEHALITVPHLSNQTFTSLSLKPAYSRKLNIRFVYYYCFVLGKWCQEHTNVAKFHSVKMEKFKRFKFPIPPLSIQKKIVKILDSFTKLESSLKAELKAELKARLQQYDYYRNFLFTFDKDDGNDECDSVKWKTLGEVGEFVRGNGLQKKDLIDNGVGCIHYGQIYTHYGTYANKTKSFISESLANKLRKAQVGDLVIATTGESDEELCKSVAWLGEEEVAVSSDAYIYQHVLNSKYVAYFFKTDQFHKQKRPYITGTKVRRISGDNLSKIKIPVPPAEEQERIVTILDKFDELVNVITCDIPAEIASRRKQYEHYQNQILTFKEFA